jgi:hypothetical protein
MEWKMVWKEILFTIAGFISVMVPQSLETQFSHFRRRRRQRALRRA